MLTMRNLIPWNRSHDVATGRAVEHPLLALQREFDRLFEDLWRGVDLPMVGGGDRMMALISPRIEVSEKAKEIIVAAELPGLQEKDVEVTLTDNVLTIRGEKRLHKSEEKGEGFTYSERSYGAFERRIPIEAEVLADKVSASFTDGVLTVTLPKHPETTPNIRRIPVDGGAGREEPKAA